MADIETFGATNDQKKMINKLKHDLEDWREIILFLNSVLKWERRYDPAVIFTIISSFFLVLCYLDFSILTLISLAALSMTLLDYTTPIIAKLIFKSSAWTGVQEKKYEDVCVELCAVKCKITQWYNFLFVTKERNSTMFYISISMTLIVLAYTGAIIDNLFLSYLAVLSIGMYPGLQQHGIVNTVKEKLFGCVSGQVNGVMQKVFDKKKSN